MGGEYYQSLLILSTHIKYFMRDIRIINDLQLCIYEDNYSLDKIFLMIKKHYELTLQNDNDNKYFEFSNIKNIFELLDKDKFRKFKSFGQFWDEVLKVSHDKILKGLDVLLDKSNKLQLNASNLIQEKESEIEQLINS